MFKVARYSVMRLAGILCLFVLPLIGVSPVVLAHETTAHLRIANFVANTPNFDVSLDQGMVLLDITPGSLSDFLEVEAGKNTVTFTPVAGADAQVSIAPVDIMLEADHSYSLSTIGQTTDSNLNTIVIDETAETNACDMSNNVLRILINNISGADKVSFYENNMWIEKNIPYGGFVATCTHPFFWDTGKLVLGEDLDKILFDFDNEEDGNGGFWEPYTVYFWGLMGKYPGEADTDYTFGGGNWYTVAPDPVAFLSAFTDKKLTSNSKIYYEFKILINAIKTAGLEETLAQDKPLTLFVPTDYAFNNLPTDQLDILLKDKDKLRQFILSHVVEGISNYEDMTTAGKLKTLAGNELTITASEDDGATFRINGATVANYWYPLANGSQIWFVDDRVLVSKS